MRMRACLRACPHSCGYRTARRPLDEAGAGPARGWENVVHASPITLARFHRFATTGGLTAGVHGSDTRVAVGVRPRSITVEPHRHPQTLHGSVCGRTSPCVRELRASGEWT